MVDKDRTATMPEIRVPARLTFAALAAGLAAGLVLSGTAFEETALAVAAPVGTLWLRALQMTIVPLVAALLFTGIVQTVAAARAGAMARRTLGLFVAILAGGATLAALLMPLLLDLLPIPGEAAGALGAMASAEPGPLPAAADFVASLVPQNAIAAAAEGAMVPLIVFMALFALAATRLGEAPRRLLADLFEAIAAAMMIVIGWVLALAPIGVFALALRVAAESGTAAIGALAHYIALVSALGLSVLVAAYALAVLAARLPPGAFARAALPAQAVAFSTQSSLASLPAMLAGCARLGVRPASADFVLPLAVALFRATSPAMNLAVAIYAARLTGVELTPALLATGVAVALLTTLGSVSLPGTISFVASVGPIALAMGVPLEPLALLVAVEMLPDIVRTVGNVTMDIAVTATVDRRAPVDGDPLDFAAPD
jgi:Na+/H+-dicarboxylate symporter